MLVWVGFALKLLCFSKISKFLFFDQSKLLLDRSKLRLKIRFESAWLDQCSIDARSIEFIFRLIKAHFWPIEIRKLSFIKSFSSCVLHYFKSFFKLFLTFSLRLIQSKDFCRFLPQISPRFLSWTIGKSFIPFLFQLNNMFHAFSCTFLKKFEHSNLGFLVHFNCF